MSEIWGIGIYDMIVLACWKLPPHIWELVIRLQWGRADPFPDLRIGRRGLWVGRDSEQHLQLGEGHLWRVLDRSCGNIVEV